MRRLFALLAAALLIAIGTPALAASPVSMAISPNLAASLEKVPEKARARTDTISIGVPDLYGQVNPLFANTIGDTYAADLLFDELVFLDEYGTAGDGLAHMAVSGDGLTYTFELRPARYSDEALVSADDCLNTLYLMLMPAYDGSRDLSPLDIAGVAEYLAGEADTVSGLVKLTETSFSVTLNKPNASAPQLLALPALRVAHFGSAIRPSGMGDSQTALELYYKQRLREVREADAWLAGYGQYDLASMEPGVKASFVANADYWRAKPSTQNIELAVVPLEESYNAIYNGDVDIINCYPDYSEIEKVYDRGDGFISFYSWMGDTFGYLSMRVDSPLFADERVRKAFAHGLNRGEILRATLGNYASTPGMLLFDSFAEKADVLGELYPYDVSVAAALLDEAGWVAGEGGSRSKDGKPFTFTFVAAAANPTAESVVASLRTMCDYLGLTFEVKLIPFEELIAVQGTDAYDMCLMARRLPMSPVSAVNLFEGDSHLNDSGYSSDGMERFANWAQLETSKDRQSIVLEGLYQQLYIELPVIPLYRRFELMLVNARVRNIYISTAHNVTAEAYRMIITTSLVDEN